MPKISIIVPIYKVEPYLKRCVDSILNQTFTDFECILVDDGSPDNCPQICDEYAKKDKRIRVIHKKNGGLSDARNAGIDIAQGEYLGFIDSDDWIHPQMYEILYQGIVENNVRLSVCAYNETDTEQEFERIDKPVFELHNGMDFLMADNVTAVVAWNKLYHRSLFKEIRYPVGRIHEDEFTTYKILYKAGNIAFCDFKMYYYFMNFNGITKSKYTIRQMDEIIAVEERNLFIKKNKDLKRYFGQATKQLIKVYWNQYLSVAKEEQYKEIQCDITNRMRKQLIFYGKKANVDISHYANYYDIAFPNLMKVYWIWKIIKNKLKKEGLINTVFKILKKIKHKLGQLYWKIYRKLDDVKYRMRKSILYIYNFIKGIFVYDKIDYKKIGEDVVICAHPDDETIFFYSIIKKYHPYIICLSNRGHKIRRKEFYNTLEYMGVPGVLLNFPDFPWLKWSLLEFILTVKLKRIHNKCPIIKRVFTHNSKGESGHSHHFAVGRAVQKVFSDKSIFLTSEEKYEIGELTVSERKDKHMIIHDMYSSQYKMLDLWCPWFEHYMTYEYFEQK